MANYRSRSSRERKLRARYRKKIWTCGIIMLIVGLVAGYVLCMTFIADAPASPDLAQASQINKMKELLVFIHSNYTSPLSLKEAAGYCGYSVSYFTKFFKAFTGMTLVEYINHYRLEKAAELLLTTDLSVIEISESCGFENHSYFIRLFQRHYQTTPLKYRRLGARKENL